MTAQFTPCPHTIQYNRNQRLCYLHREG